MSVQTRIGSFDLIHDIIERYRGTFVADGANLRKSDCEEDFRPLKAKLTVVDRLRRLQAAELAQPMQMG